MERFDDVIERFELGIMPEEDMIPVMQHLIDTSYVWQMPQAYQDAAVTLLAEGKCRAAA